MDDLRVLVVADDVLARAGLATLLEGQPGCIVVGQLGSETDLLLENASTWQVYRPEVVLWDLGWEPETSLERLAQVQEAGLPIAVLFPNDEYAVEAWYAGARGLLSRDTDPAALVAALKAVSCGMAVLDPALADALFPSQDRPPARLVEGLTPRELQVLQLLAEGLPNKAIAHRLDISEHTVKFHVNAILGKLGAQSRTEAVVRATRMGLILL